MISPSLSMLSLVKLSEQKRPKVSVMFFRYQELTLSLILEFCCRRTPSIWHGTPTTASGPISCCMASCKASVLGE